MLPLSYSALADFSVLPVQTVGFDGIGVSAINVSGTIQSMVVETNYRSCMLRFWPGSSAKVAFVISNPSFFRVRSGFKYHLKLRASLSGLAFKKIGVAFGIDGGNLMNLPAEDIHYDFTYTSNNAYAYFEQTSGIFQRDYTFSTVAFVFELTSAVSSFNFWLADFTVQEIDPNQEIVDGIGDKVDNQTNQQKGFFEKLGDRIGGFFTDLFNNIMDGLKKLFIPDQEYIVRWAQDMQQFLKDHFGALYAPIDIVTRFITGFFSIEGSEDIAITFPAIEFGDVKLSDPVEFHFSEVTGLFGDLYTTYLYIADVIVIVGFILFCEKKLERILTK